jgi:hypothetical protein
LGIGDWGLEIWDWGLGIWDLRFGIEDLRFGIENLGAAIEGWQIMKSLIVLVSVCKSNTYIDFYSIYQSSICLRLIRCNH